MMRTATSLTSRANTLEYNRIKKLYDDLDYRHSKIKEFVMKEMCEECRTHLLKKLEEVEDEPIIP
ncbi:hypothetical protein [Methanospirillum sp.]